LGMIGVEKRTGGSYVPFVGLDRNLALFSNLGYFTRWLTLAPFPGDCSCLRAIGASCQQCFVVWWAKKGRGGVVSEKRRKRRTTCLGRNNYMAQAPPSLAPSRTATLLRRGCAKGMTAGQLAQETGLHTFITLLDFLLGHGAEERQPAWYWIRRKTGVCGERGS